LFEVRLSRKENGYDKSFYTAPPPMFHLRVSNTGSKNLILKLFHGGSLGKALEIVIFLTYSII